MPILDAILSEFDRELPVTLRVLERVPVDKLTWTPHAKSKPIGNLAWHIATIPARALMWGREGDYDVATSAPLPVPGEPGAIPEGMRKHSEELRAYLMTLDDAALKEGFTLRAGSKVMFQMPKVAMLRNLLMNHTYHHRGQLTVYLRLLDIPVPAVYGASADESPLG